MPPQGTAYQTIEGWGSFFRDLDRPDFWGLGASGTDGAGSVPTLSEAEKDLIFSTVYTTAGLGMTRARWCDPLTARGAPAYMVTDPEPANDNADPYVAVGFDFSGLAGAVEWVTRAKALELDTFWWSPNQRPAWLGAGDAWGYGGSNPAVVTLDVQEYGEWYVQIVNYLASQGAAPDVLSPGNEPSFVNGANRMSKEYYREMTKEIGPRLDALGLLVPMSLGDDNTLVYENALIDTVMADATAAGYYGSLSTHLYDKPLQPNLADLKTRGVTYGLPLWMSEFSYPSISTISDRATYGMAAGTPGPIDYAVLMHYLLTEGDMTAVDYMCAIFGQQETAALAEVNYVTGGGAMTGVTVRREGYYFGQFSKYVRPGDVRVACASSDAGAKVSAYWRPTGTIGRTTVVAVNPTASPITTTISAADLAGKSTATVVRSSATEDWAAQTDQAVAAGAMTATLPAESVTTFIADPDTVTLPKLVKVGGELTLLP